MTSDKKTVCVTGASGFVGSQIVVDLLERGYQVCATVRDPSNTEKYGFLLDLPGAREGLTLHRGQLLEEGCFDEAMEGSDFCIHTASPYVLDAEEPQRDLVDPAVQGTENVLRSATKAGVQRVVLTSSMAAVTDEPESDKVLTEEDWNEKSSLERNPYGDFATRLFSYFQPAGTGSYLRTHLGKVPSFDNTKSREVLGLDYRAPAESVLDTVEDLKRWGHLEG